MPSIRHALFLVAMAAGCSTGGRDHTISLVDASPGGNGGGGGGGGADAPAQAACLLSSSLGSPAPTAMQEQAHWHTAMGQTAPGEYYLFAALNGDMTPDVLLLDLYKGYGAFTSGYPTGSKTIQLTGDEIDGAKCGACVSVQTDYTMSGPTGDPYFATGGTLTLTSVSNTMISGSLSNVSFTHVMQDTMTGATTPINDGCTSMLTSVNFSAVPTSDAMFTGGTRWKLQIERPTN